MIFSQTIIAGRKKNRHIGPYAMTYLIFVLTIGGSLSCSLTYFKMSFLVAIKESKGSWSQLSHVMA